MNATILLVDDQDIMFRLLKTTLKPLNAECATASTGGEAIAYFEAGGRPSVMLLDFSMPDMDGVATLRAIRDTPTGADVPVVMLTARDRISIREAAEGLGVKAFVTKPFSPSGLVETVREAIRSCVFRGPRIFIIVLSTFHLDIANSPASFVSLSREFPSRCRSTGLTSEGFSAHSQNIHQNAHFSRCLEGIEELALNTKRAFCGVGQTS